MERKSAKRRFSSFCHKKSNFLLRFHIVRAEMRQKSTEIINKAQKIRKHFRCVLYLE